VIIKGDLHIHSNLSDGRDDPEKILRRARELDLEAISITDHDTFRAHLNGRKVEILLIPGIEITSSKGHIVVLCEKPESRLEVLKGSEPEEIIEEAESLNCLPFPSHPFDPFRKSLGKALDGLKLKAIEVFNPRAPNFANSKALKYSQMNGIAGLANSDSHLINSIGSSYSFIDVNELTAGEIIDAIAKGRIVRRICNYLSVKVKIEAIKWYIKRRI